MKYTKKIQKTEEKEMETKWNVGDTVTFQDYDCIYSLQIMTISYDKGRGVVKYYDASGSNWSEDFISNNLIT